MAQPSIVPHLASRVGTLAIIGATAAIAGLTAGARQADDTGEALYRQYCANCHDGSVPRAPARSALGALSADALRFAISTGSMKTQAAALSSVQQERLVGYLTTRTAVERPTDNSCRDSAPFEGPLTKPHWNGWGVDLSQSRFQPAAMARLTAAQVPGLSLKWAFGFPDVQRMYGQPTVVGGRVFVGSAGRKVYSLGASSGCQYWVFDSEFPVRTAITIGPDGAGWTAFFGDQHANAYAVDAITGKLRWKVHLDEHQAALITGAPTLADGVLYVPVSSGEEVLGADPKYSCCTFRGSITALEAATGKVRWKSYTIVEEPTERRPNKAGTRRWGPSGAPVWSSPTVDRRARRVYVTTGDSYSDPAASTSDAIVAFDANTGKLLWARQMTSGDAFTIDCDFPEAFRANCPDANGPDFDFGTSPMLLELPNGRRALVAGQKSGIVHAVDPDEQGKILWQTRVGKGGRLGGVQWGLAADAQHVYVAVSDVAIAPVPPGTPGAQPSPLGIALALDPTSGGGLFALDRETGKIVWSTPHPGCGKTPACSPAQSAAVTAIPGAVFSGGLDGHLRAYSASSGQIIWDVDTKKSFTTVNGVKAAGGSIDGPGAVVVDGMVFVNSGYEYLGHTPGNVLLAFSVEGSRR